jgi:hypothetical protein
LRRGRGGFLFVVMGNKVDVLGVRNSVAEEIGGGIAAESASGVIGENGTGN